MLAETSVPDTEHKPLAPFCVDQPQPDSFNQNSHFQDLPERQRPTRILTHTETPLSCHTMHTHAESVKHAGGNISRFNYALHDASAPRHNIKLTSHSPSHHNESHTAHSNVFELAKFLARCDLLTGGLSRFSDKPEK